MPKDFDLDLCCQAINQALASYTSRIVPLIASGAAAIEANFPDPAEAAQRTAISLAAVTAVSGIIRTALQNLVNLTCESPCCESAARAIAEVGVAAVANINTAVGLVSVPTAGLQTVINGIITGLNASIALIASTVTCPVDRCPCPPRPHCKPIRKLKKCH